MTSRRLYRAPGRVNLIGEHTDYTGGLALPVAIDRTVDLAVTPGDGRIRLRSTGASEAVDVSADGSDAPREGWGRYVSAVAAVLAERGRPAVGLTGQVSSDLPQGAGLSSSAALEVVVAIALLDVAGLELPPWEIAAACQEAEHRAVGVPSGIMDQAASLLGRADHAVLVDCGLRSHELVALPPGLDIVIIDSNVSRTLEGSGYAQRRRELEAGMVALQGRRPQEVDPDEVDELIERAGLADVPARRLRHVVSENHRVRAVVQLLAEGCGGARLGELFLAGHTSLRDDFEVSTPELDALVELSYEHGAVAARMTGGGFGGAVVALAERGSAEDLGARVADGYAASSPGRRATVHVCRAADGARRLDA